jgi:hypothetical protein
VAKINSGSIVNRNPDDPDNPRTTTTTINVEGTVST